jgi:hypothetical protein
MTPRDWAAFDKFRKACPAAVGTETVLALAVKALGLLGERRVISPRGIAHTKMK